MKSDTQIAQQLWLSTSFDEAFRRVLDRRREDAGPLTGPVEPVFAATLVLESDDLVQVDYRVDYRDSVRIVATEGARLRLPRAESCR